MRVKFFSIIIALISIGDIQAQNYCGFDESKQLFLSHTKRAEKHDQYLTGVLEWIKQNENSNRDELTCIIPVVVHVIHQNGGENIPDEMIEDAIEYLNSSFSNQDIYYSPEGTVIPIQFCLAHVDPDGNFSSGINRIESPLTTVVVPDQDLELKELSRWDTEKYMNVWVVNELIRADNSFGIVGNSSMPSTHGSETDGIIIEASFFGGTAVQTKVFIHEAGHYLGLFHTFESTCNNDNCLEDGDKVCDTPPDGIAAPFDCENGANSCDTDDDDLSENNPFRPMENGGMGDQPDQQQNYMDYSPLTCYEFFTLGQCDRMLASLLTARASLLEGDRCNPPCSSAIEISVEASANEIFLGESVVFTNNSIGNTTTTWFVNEEQVSTSTDYEFLPDQTGFYFVEVLLSNNEPGCNIELEYDINVECPVQPIFGASSNNPQPEEEVVLVNVSSGADSYQWFIDGSLYSIDENITLIFETLGAFQVCLEAISGNCSSFYCSNFDVGTCASGQENSNWYLFTGEALVNNINFDESVTSFQNFYLDYSENKSSISDNNGNLLFITNGESLFNQNLQTTPNGNELAGHISSRKGALLVNAPGADDLIYLFTLDANENEYANGLRYSIIDRTLDNGNGDIVVGSKNLLIDQVNTETMTAIRHCNYADFWLVYYDESTQQFISWEVNPSGISNEPVLSSYSSSNFTQSNIYYQDIKVSPKGNLFAKGNILFSFDNGTGVVTEFLNYSPETVSFYDFAPNGRFFYAQTATGLNQVRLNQFDLSLPIDQIIPQVFFVNQPIFAAYSDIQTTPAGEILLAGVFSGTLDRISFPNLNGSDMQLEYTVLFDTGFLNGFGNYYHAYSQEQIFIEGPVSTCKGSETIYQIAGCPEGTIEWSILPEVNFTQIDGQMHIEFPEPGLYMLEVSLQTECGLLRGEMNVSVTDAIEPNLGPDMNICVGENLNFTPGAGYTSYLWNNGSEEESISVSLPGTYSVEVINAEGCNYSDQVEVGQIITGDIDLGPDFDFCDTVMVLNAGNDFLNYTWQDGITGSTYTVFEPGTYSVTASIPCEAFDEVVVVDCTIGISEYENDVISVYPNPAEESIFIELHDLPFSQGSFSIFDATGRSVRHGIIISHLTRLEIGLLASGIYTLQIQLDDRESVVELLVK